MESFYSFYKPTAYLFQTVTVNPCHQCPRPTQKKSLLRSLDQISMVLTAAQELPALSYDSKHRSLKGWVE